MESGGERRLRRGGRRWRNPDGAGLKEEMLVADSSSERPEAS